MNRRDFLSTSSKAACACALGTASVLLSHCSAPTEPSTPIDSTGVELEFDLLDSNYSNFISKIQFFIAFILS